ncbi:hypothetical protein M1293_01855 [Candidatus Parvarchaeota archaeon]|nr:hypothetical protein [Candidatus Parvarchaeota archaeon]
MSLTHKSQSALEYMMTYGWAILIIVIVAAVLYSFGIFSPSSSISGAVTGFYGLGSVGADCTGGGGLILTLGDSLQYPINITQINVSSISETMPNITISPSEVYSFYVPVLCPPAGSHFSYRLVVTYKELGSPLPGPYVSSGSAYGTATSDQLFITGWNISNCQPYSAVSTDPLIAQDIAATIAQGFLPAANSTGNGYAYGSGGYYGNNYNGFIVGYYPTDLKQLNLGSPTGCGGSSEQVGSTVIGVYDFVSNTVNFNITTDDAMEVFFRPVGGGSWTSVFGGSAWHGQGATYYNARYSVSPGLYLVAIAWNNMGGGSGMTQFWVHPAYLS